MADAVWKQFERDVARIFGARRNPLSGRNNAGRSGDVISDEFEVECKLRNRISIFRWWEKVARDAEVSGKTPVLVMREKGNKRTVLVCVSQETLATMLRSRPGDYVNGEPNHLAALVSQQLD